MGKSIEKKQRYNALVVAKLADRYDCTVRFVRMSISGERDSAKAELIKKDYVKLMKEVQSIFNK